VTFTSTGFSTVRREGIELPAQFTMTLNADLKVGAVEESITVTGASPVVDVTTAVHTSVLNREAVDNIPTGRAVIVPRSIANQSTLTIALIPPNATFVERITQFDIKVSKSFKVNRFTVAPVFEMFNLNNSDAIISYQSTSYISQQYLAPNSIMQPRMIGIGAQVKW
jgi:hypothetical protein